MLTQVVLTAVLAAGALMKAVEIPGTRGRPRSLLTLLVGALAVLAVGQALGVPSVLRALDGPSEGVGLLAFQGVTFVGLFLVLVFFTAVDDRVRDLRRTVRTNAVLLVAVLGAMAVLLASTPRGHRATTAGSPYVEFPTVAWFYIVGNVYLVYVFARCALGLGARGGGAGRLVATARWIILAGLVGLVGAALLRGGRIGVVLADGPDPSWAVETVAHLGLLASGAVVGGLTLCGVAQALRTVRRRIARRRAYAQLDRLWRLLTERYPDVVLGADRGPSSWWPRRPTGLRYRFHRRVVECRDGLHRLGPTLAAVARTSDLTGWTPSAVAERISVAVAVEGDHPVVQEGAGCPRLLPDPAESSLPEEVAALVAISRELPGRRTAGPSAPAGRRTAAAA